MTVAFQRAGMYKVVLQNQGTVKTVRALRMERPEVRDRSCVMLAESATVCLEQPGTETTQSISLPTLRKASDVRVLTASALCRTCGT